jgi:hypothetical protein
VVAKMLEYCKTWCNGNKIIPANASTNNCDINRVVLYSTFNAHKCICNPANGTKNIIKAWPE